MQREYPAGPLIAVGTVVLKAGCVLLIRRGRAPGLGRWSIPGGAQQLGETVEAAARRELREETGVAVGTLHFLTHVDLIEPGPDGRPRYHYTVLDFAGAWVAGQPVAADDAADARFVPIVELGPYGLTDELRRVITLAQAALGGV